MNLLHEGGPPIHWLVGQEEGCWQYLILTVCWSWYASWLSTSSTNNVRIYKHLHTSTRWHAIDNATPWVRAQKYYKAALSYFSWNTQILLFAHYKLVPMNWIMENITYWKWENITHLRTTLSYFVIILTLYVRYNFIVQCNT